MYKINISLYTAGNVCMYYKLNIISVQDYGIPQHYGLFYAMGIGLMMEGVLSACYHVCPNKTNYQFGKYQLLIPC